MNQPENQPEVQTTIDKVADFLPSVEEQQSNLVAELTAQVAILTAQVENQKNRAENYYTRFCEKLNQISVLEEYLDTDDNWEELGDHAEAIADLFGIEHTVTKTVSITITGTMEVSAPRGFDWDSLDNSEFDISVRANLSSWSDLTTESSFYESEIEVEVED